MCMQLMVALVPRTSRHTAARDGKMARTLRLESEAEIAGNVLDKERFCSAPWFLREFHMSRTFVRAQLQGIVWLIHPLGAPNNIIEVRYCQST